MTSIFPTIVGKNLNKHKVTIPNDFSQRDTVVIIAFQRWHQQLVDTTIETLERSNIQNSHNIIEVPVVSQLSLFRRMRLDAIMRAGIRDYLIRQRTITVYTDKEEFKQKLAIPNEDDIHWFVVSHSSKEILNRGIGVISLEDINRILFQE